MCISAECLVSQRELQRCYLYTQLCISLWITAHPVETDNGVSNLLASSSYVELDLSTVIHRFMHNLNNCNIYKIVITFDDDSTISS